MSHLPPRAHTVVPGKHRFVTHERLEKFTSTTYWRDCNIIAVEDRLASQQCVESEVTIMKWTEPKSVYDNVPPGYDRSNVTFDIAKSIFDNPKNAESFGTPPSKVEKATIGDRFGGLNTNHWFKINVKVTKINPETVPRKVDIRLAWHTGSEGLVYTKDGTVVGGVTGEGRDFIPLTFDIDPNNFRAPFEWEGYVEMVCSARMGDGKPTFISDPDMTRHFTLEKCEVQLIDRMIRRLHSDVELMHSFATTEGVPDTLAEDALVWGNRVVNAFIHDQPETHVVAAKIAEEFFEKHSQPREGDAQDEITMLGNCHIDLVWLWRFRETRRKIARSWASQLLLAQSPDRTAPYRFVASQAIQYQWLKEDYPELFERVAAECRNQKDGSFVSLGATWVEMDGNLPSGESFMRQFVIGQNFYREHFGAVSPIFWEPDTFGYSPQLTQISAHCGCKYFVSQKLSWNLMNKPAHTTFYWKGIDGVTDGSTTLLCHFPPQDNYCCQVTVDEIVVKSAVSKQNRDLGRARECLMLYGDGDGGGGPKEPLLLRAERFQKMTTLPLRVRTDRTPMETFKRLEADDKKLPQLQTHVGELYFEMHRGTFSVHRRIKSKIFEQEEMLRTTEAVCAIAAILSRTSKNNSNNKKYSHPTKKIWQLWSDHLITHFHDLSPGSSIHDVYRDAFAICERARESQLLLISEAARFVADAVSPNDADREMNLDSELKLNFSTTEVEGQSGHSIYARPKTTASENTSGLGSPQQQQQSAKQFSVSAFGNHGAFKIMNSKMVCVVEADGRITSFKLLTNSRGETIEENDAVEHVGATNKSWLHWNLYDDVPLFWDAWDIEIYHLEKPLMSHGAEVVKKTRVEHLEGGNAVEVITELTVKSNVTIEQRLLFTASQSDIHVSANVKNWANEKSKHRLLKCLFGCNIVSPNAHFGTAFGAVERPTHRNSSYDVAKFEVCFDKWLDFSQSKLGVTIANNCGMRGASVQGSTIHMSVLRSPTAPDPACDEGDHDLTFVIRPHNKSHYSDAGSVDLAASLSKVAVVDSSSSLKTTFENPSPLLARGCKSNEDLLFQWNLLVKAATVNSDDLDISAIKLPEYHDDAKCDSTSSIDVIVRLVERVGSCVPAGRKLTLFPATANSSLVRDQWKSVKCIETDGLERENKGELASLTKNEFSLPEFKPFQIRTFKFTVSF